MAMMMMLPAHHHLGEKVLQVLFGAEMVSRNRLVEPGKAGLVVTVCSCQSSLQLNTAWSGTRVADHDWVQMRV